MTRTIAFRLPRLGGAEAEARILGWRKSPGDVVDRDEVLLEVETDKAVVEVLSPCDGVLLDHLKAPDQVAAFDEALAHIEAHGELPAGLEPEEIAVPVHSEAPAKAETVDTRGMDIASSQPVAAPAASSSSGRPAASPYARRLAVERGVNLQSVSGSGPNGRVVAADVLRAGGQAPTQGLGQASGRSQQRVTETEVATSRGAVACRIWNADRTDTPAIVLVHGLFGDADVWTGMAGSLAAADRKVVAIDLPAHGRTRATATTLDDIAMLLDEVLLSTVDQAMVLVGHSFGAAVAARCASRRSARQLEALVLLAPAGLGTEIAADFLNGMRHAASVPVLRRELEKLGDALPAFGDVFLQGQLEGIQKRASQLEDLLQNLARHGVQQIDIRQDLADAACPINIYWGRRDRILPWEHALNAPPRAALHLIPHVGHMPQWESGALIVERLLQLSEP